MHARGRVRGVHAQEGGGLSFPLNCPTWLSVLSLNKHSHFLLAAHIDRRAHTGTSELPCTKTSMGAHMYERTYT